MDEKMIFVTSQSDMTLVLNVPEIPMHKIWKKRGAKVPVDRIQLEQAFYDPSVEYLFRQGLLTTDDKTFLKDVGLMTEEEKPTVVVLTPALMMKMIKTMSLTELKSELKKLSTTQIEELGEFAIEHFEDLKMDRIEILKKATGKDILTSIANARAEQEG